MPKAAPSAEQQKSDVSRLATLDQIGEVRSRLEPAWLGPYGEARIPFTQVSWNSMRRYWSNIGYAEGRFRAEVQSMVNAAIFELTGEQLSIAEAERLMGPLPTLDKPVDQFMSALD